MSPTTKPDLTALFRSGNEIQRACQAAARQVAIEHKALGFPLVIWRDGEVVHVAPEDIEILPDPYASSASTVT